MKAAVLILIAIAAVPCKAQLPEEFRTPSGELTEYYWRSLQYGEKLTFVLGFQAGYLDAAPSNEAAREEARKSCLAQFTNPTLEQYRNCVDKSLEIKTEEYKRWDSLDPLPDGTFGETIEATDRFFAEPENRVMPVASAWILAKWKREREKSSQSID